MLYVVCMCICYMYVCMYVYVCLCMCVCIFVCCMSAIRTGRYTHSKKAADIIEVKTLEGTMKSTQKMKDYNELVDALHKGVKNTDMIDLLTTHHSQLNIMDRKIQSQMVILPSSHLLSPSPIFSHLLSPSPTLILFILCQLPRWSHLPIVCSFSQQVKFLFW